MLQIMPIDNEPEQKFLQFGYIHRDYSDEKIVSNFGRHQ